MGQEGHHGFSRSTMSLDSVPLDKLEVQDVKRDAELAVVLTGYYDNVGDMMMARWLFRRDKKLLTCTIHSLTVNT